MGVGSILGQFSWFSMSTSPRMAESCLSPFIQRKGGSQTRTGDQRVGSWAQQPGTAGMPEAEQPQPGWPPYCLWLSPGLYLPAGLPLPFPMGIGLSSITPELCWAAARFSPCSLRWEVGFPETRLGSGGRSEVQFTGSLVCCPLLSGGRLPHPIWLSFHHRRRLKWKRGRGREGPDKPIPVGPTVNTGVAGSAVSRVFWIAEGKETWKREGRGKLRRRHPEPEVRGYTLPTSLACRACAREVKVHGPEAKVDKVQQSRRCWLGRQNRFPPHPHFYCVTAPEGDRK